MLLSYDEAVALLPGGEEIHTFFNPAIGMLIGADWSRAAVLKLLAQSPQREVSGPSAQSMGHGLAAYRDGRAIFIETRTEVTS